MHDVQVVFDTHSLLGNGRVARPPQLASCCISQYLTNDTLFQIIYNSIPNV